MFHRVNCSADLVLEQCPLCGTKLLFDVAVTMSAQGPR
jgi:hypothetical protein